MVHDPMTSHHPIALRLAGLDRHVKASSAIDKDYKNDRDAQVDWSLASCADSEPRVDSRNDDDD